MTQNGGSIAQDFLNLDLSEGVARRRSVTTKATASKYQEKRRQEALLKQQQARADRTHQARQLALQRADKEVSSPG